MIVNNFTSLLDVICLRNEKSNTYTHRVKKKKRESRKCYNFYISLKTLPIKNCLPKKKQCCRRKFIDGDKYLFSILKLKLKSDDITKSEYYDKINALSNLINATKKKIIAYQFNFCCKASQQHKFWKQRATLDQTTGEKRLETHKHGQEKSCHSFLFKFPKASSRAGSDMVKR